LHLVLLLKICFERPDSLLQVVDAGTGRLGLFIRRAHHARLLF
jgi:hypothetical protein